MADKKSQRISYKSQVTSPDISNQPAGQIVNGRSQTQHPVRDDHLSRRMEVYDVLTATSAASQLTDWTAQIADNQKRIEDGVRYHGNASFAKTFDLYAKCRSFFGSSVEIPSLPALLDLQEKTLGNYASCLGKITRYVDEQQVIITEEVDLMEKQLSGYDESTVGKEIIALRSQLAQTGTHSARRELTNQIYKQDRLHRRIGDSKVFFDQYITQEATLRDVGHSLRLLTDQTQLFETYISKSKGFFVSVTGIGQVVAHMSPVVSKMKMQTLQLQENVEVVISYLGDRSGESLFTRELDHTSSRG